MYCTAERQGWEFDLLLKIALFKEWPMTMSDSLSSLFKKEPPWANRSRRVFTKEQPGENRSRRSIKKYVSDSLVIRSFALKIRAIRSKKLVLFTKFFTFFHCFSPFMPNSKSLPSVALYKRATVRESLPPLFKKERATVIDSLPRANRYFAFSFTKTSHWLENPTLQRDKQ